MVSGFAYLRRDVTPSPHRVEITLQNKHIFEAVNHARALSADQARLALLTGVGLSYADEPRPSACVRGRQIFACRCLELPRRW